MKSWIINKEFNLGEKIPSENELAAKFNVSRLTIRQAISQLTQEGFLRSKRGEGTFVTDNENLINSFGLEFRGVMDDLFFHQISEFRIKSVSINKILSPKLVREKLELDDEDKEVIQIKRVRFLRGILFTFTVNYLPLKIGTRITENDLYQKPLMQIFTENFDIQFTEAVQTIEASFADQEVSEKLGIASGSPVLFVERIMYGENHKPIELFQSSYRGDQYKFIVRFKNVKRKDTNNKWIQQALD